MKAVPSICLILTPMTLMIATAYAADPTPGATPVAQAAPVQPATTGDSSTTTSPAPADENTLPRVTVTSQKRSQDITSVPISITAISGEDLTDERIQNYEDLSRAVPGLSFDSLGANEGLSNIVIRGVSSTAGSSTVGIYLDDVAITTKSFYGNGAAEPRIIDLQSVEVLRGPQGTLYGDSSEGGTIRFLSNQPNMDLFSGEVSADTSYTAHGGENYASTLILNVPINPGIFALRGSINVDHEAGWIDHYSLGGKLEDTGVNSSDGLTAHLIGKLTPGDGWTITPTLYFQSVSTDDNAAFYPALGLYNQSKEVSEPSKDNISLATLSVQKTLGFANLTSITGAYLRRFNRQEDGTFFNSTVFAEAFLDPLYPQHQPQNDSIIGTLPSQVHMDTGYRQFSEELRLSSKDEDGTNRLKWVAGLYVDEQTIHNSDFQQIPGINQAFKGIYGIPLEASLVQTTFGAPGISLFPDSIDESDVRSYTERQVAIFGQADYDLTPDWRASFGARYSFAKENFDSTEQGFYQIGNISPYFQEADFHSFTPKASISHDLTPDSTVYASASEGFRLGGPTGPIVYGPTSVCASDFAAIGQTSQPKQFDSDSLWTYELGTKNTLDNNHVAVNASIYYTDWHNIQQQIYLPTCGYYFTANVGNAAIYGGELEAAWRATRNLKLTASLSGQKATITQTANAADVPVGSHLIDVPELSATLGVSYTSMISDNLSLISRADYSFTGHSYGSYQASNPDYSNPGYGVLNASLTFTRDKYELTFYAKNLLNNQTIIQRPEINTVVEGYTVHPRVVGLTGRFMF
jgi:outer membrane receptor protein involved in Fe transport